MLIRVIKVSIGVNCKQFTKIICIYYHLKDTQHSTSKIKHNVPNTPSICTFSSVVHVGLNDIKYNKRIDIKRETKNTIKTNRTCGKYLVSVAPSLT